MALSTLGALCAVFVGVVGARYGKFIQKESFSWRLQVDHATVIPSKVWRHHDEALRNASATRLISLQRLELSALSTTKAFHKCNFLSNSVDKGPSAFCFLPPRSESNQSPPLSLNQRSAAMSDLRVDTKAIENKYGLHSRASQVR